MAIFEGAGVALITPFKENGEDNLKSWRSWLRSRLQEAQMPLLHVEQPENLLR